MRRSPRILERYCHDLYEVENREPIAELGWDTDAFIQGRRANWKSEISQPSTTFGPRAPPPWSTPFSTARLARWLTTRGCRRRRRARLMAPGRRHGSQATSPPTRPTQRPCRGVAPHRPRRVQERAFAATSMSASLSQAKARDHLDASVAKSRGPGPCRIARGWRSTMSWNTYESGPRRRRGLNHGRRHTRFICGFSTGCSMSPIARSA